MTGASLIGKQLKESCTKIQICLRLKILRTDTYSVACPYFPMKKFFSSSSTFHSCSIIDIAIRNINISNIKQLKISNFLYVRNKRRINPTGNYSKIVSKLKMMNSKLNIHSVPSFSLIISVIQFRPYPFLSFQSRYSTLYPFTIEMIHGR